MDTAHSPLSEYPGIPGILGRSWDHPGMDTAHHPPCLSILGFLGYSDDLRIIPGWMDTTPTPPLSEYPGIPGILGRSQDHPGMDTAHSPLSEYPGIPGILGRSWDHPGMDTAHHPPCLSILGFLGYSDDPGIIPGWTQLTTPLSEYPRNPRILRQGGVSCVHPGMIPGSSEYPRNPRILRQGGGRAVSIHPGMILGSSEYPRNPRILRQGGGELCPSWDDPRTVRVSQESQDTQTGGGGGGG